MRPLWATTVGLILATCATPASTQVAPVAGRITSLADDPQLLGRSKFTGVSKQLALDLLLGRKGAEAAILRYLNANRDLSADDRTGLWLLVCEERHRRSLYASAISACEQAERVKAGSASTFLAFLRPLRGIAPTRWNVRSAKIPLFLDSDGNRRLHVADESRFIEAVVDTGAEMTIMMASVARRLNARPIGTSTIGTTTAPVEGGMAIVELLRIGPAELRSVPVLVLPDERLTFPDGSSLPMVLGLSSLTSAGKAAFLENGRVLALGDAVPRAIGQPVPLYWDSSGIGFEARFAKEPRAVHLDTGSRRNYLFPAAERSLSDRERRTKTAYERKIAGIGGERTEQAYRFNTVTITIAGHRWTFAPMEMAPADEEGESARIGSPMFNRFRTVILDFDRMQMFVN